MFSPYREFIIRAIIALYGPIFWRLAEKEHIYNLGDILGYG
jgi:hypothetical protein